MATYASSCLWFVKKTALLRLLITWISFKIYSVKKVMTLMNKTSFESILLFAVFYIWAAFSMAISHQTVMSRELPLTSSLNSIIFVTDDLRSRKIHPITWRMSVIRWSKRLVTKVVTKVGTKRLNSGIPGCAAKHLMIKPKQHCPPVNYHPHPLCSCFLSWTEIVWRDKRQVPNV